MNPNELDNPELDLHAVMTALVLGELEPDVAERWNARCATDPELAALRDTIRATIGAVHASLPQAPALSPQTLAALKSAAHAGPRRSTFGASWRIAIAAGTVIGVGFALTRFADDDAVRGESRTTAQGPAVGARNEPLDAGLVRDAISKAIANDAVPPKLESLDASKLGVALTADPRVLTVIPQVPEASKIELGAFTAQVESQPAPTPGGISNPQPAFTRERLELEKLKVGFVAGPTAGGGAAPSTPGGASGPMTPGGGPAIRRVDVPRVPITDAASARASGKDEEAKKLGELGYLGAGSDPSRGPGDTMPPTEGPGPAGGRIQDALTLDELTEELVTQDLDVEIAQAAVIAQPFGDVPAERAKRILDSCRPRPNETPRDMFFRWYGDHAFQRAALDRLSTFAIDVDTASYTLARKYLAAGQIPPKEAVRTEEFVNYFKPDLRAPTDGSPFAIWLEAAPSPFGHADGKTRWLLRVGVRAKDVAKEARAPLRLAFVVDTSGSMAEQNRLELVKHGLRLLATQLDARDKIAIVRFASDASVVLQWTSAADRASIESAIQGLAPSGSTNAEAGLKLGYDLAVAGLDAESTNRVVILSDGVANTGQTDQDRISADVKDKRQRGIYLNAIGVGMGNHNDVFLERLADQGDGLCSYIDDEAEAKRALVDQFVAQTTPVARDVKIQLEFDPAQVDQWRQLGYENRAIADVDFRNDAVDAGEVGAGHQIVALYEIELAANAARGDGPLTTIRLRYKQPFVAGATTQDETAKEIAATLPADAMRAKFEDASPGFQQSALVAQFAEFLRRSVHARGDSIDDLLARCIALVPRLNDAEFTEFAKLVDASRTLILSNLPRADELTQAVDSLRRNRMLSEELRQLAQAQASDVLKQLEEQNRKLEDEIRRLIEQRVK